MQGQFFCYLYEGKSKKRKLYILSTIMIVLLSIFVMTSCVTVNDNESSNEVAQSSIVATSSEDQQNVSSNSSTNYCTVIFDSNGGSDVESQSIIKGEKAKKPTDPTKEGYTFDGWYYQDEKWSFIGYIVTENMTLEAKWNINSYSLSLSTNNSTAGTISGSGTYEYGKEITITATTNSGYTLKVGMMVKLN